MGKGLEKTFLQRYKWPNNMKRCSTPLIIRDVQIKTTMKYHFTPIRMAATKKTSIGEDVEPCKLSVGV